MRRIARPPIGPLDLVGAGLVALLALWVGVFAGRGEGRPGPVLLLLGGLVVAAAAGRWRPRRSSVGPQLAAIGIAGSMVLTWPGVLDAGGAPLGYANGNATLASLGLVAALLAARGERDVGVRRGWVGIAALLGALAVAAGSTAGIFTLAVALGLLGLTAATRWTGFALIGGPIAVSIALGVTTSLALGSDLGGLRDLAEARGELWAAAAELANEEPLYGIGPGEFAERNPVSTDADLRWAHHGYLQVAAEYGLVGFLLVAALAVWVCVTLWVAAEGAPAAASMAGAAVTIVGLHASVDYVWHLPPILLVTCVLVGAGTSRAPDVGSIAV